MQDASGVEKIKFLLSTPTPTIWLKKIIKTLCGTTIILLTSLKIFSIKKISPNWKKLSNNSTNISKVLWKIDTINKNRETSMKNLDAQVEYALSLSRKPEIDLESKRS